jgi:hypothetical protein
VYATTIGGSYYAKVNLTQFGLITPFVFTAYERNYCAGTCNSPLNQTITDFFGGHLGPGDLWDISTKSDLDAINLDGTLTLSESEECLRYFEPNYHGCLCAVYDDGDPNYGGPNNELSYKTYSWNQNTLSWDYYSDGLHINISSGTEEYAYCYVGGDNFLEDIEYSNPSYLRHSIYYHGGETNILNIDINSSDYYYDSSEDLFYPKIYIEICVSNNFGAGDVGYACHSYSEQDGVLEDGTQLLELTDTVKIKLRYYDENYCQAYYGYTSTACTQANLRQAIWSI